MNLHLDINSLTLVIAPDDLRRVNRIDVKRGDAWPVVLRFYDGATPVRLPVGANITFAAKENGKYDSALIVAAFPEDWTASPVLDPDNDPYYTADISLNTTELSALLGVDNNHNNDVPFVDLMAEITWTPPGVDAATTSQNFILRVANDIWKGGESSPLELPAPENWLNQRAVRFDSSQNLNSTQKQTARTNIGAQPVGNYVSDGDSRLSNEREWTADTITQAEAEAGASTTRRAFTAQRVFQAIAAWWNASAFKTKLDGIAAGATANQADSYLLSRANHTGTQSKSTITNFDAEVAAIVASDAARRIETITNSFTAVVGGRYITENAGTISISDPTTRVGGAALVAGDSYEVWIGSGGIQFNGTGTVFQPSRFSIRRRWTGSAWVTPIPFLSDPLQIGSGQWTGSTFSGPQTFSNQVELTNQSATNGTSPVTRDIGDARYIRKSGIAVLSANADAINTVSLADRLVVANLVSGTTYLVRWVSRFSGVNPVFRLNYTGTFDRETATAFTGNAGAGAVLRNAVINANFDSNFCYGGSLSFRATSNGTLSIQHAQLVSSGSVSTMVAGSFLEVTIA